MLGAPVKDQLRDQARAAVMQAPGVSSVDVQMKRAGARAGRLPTATPGGAGRRTSLLLVPARRCLAVTTVVVNLAIALAKCGGRVGIIDAYIDGLNAPIN